MADAVKRFRALKGVGVDTIVDPTDERSWRAMVDLLDEVLR
jgi:hypothetical protein